MAIGPGKFNEIAKGLKDMFEADAVVLIVAGGSNGGGAEVIVDGIDGASALVGVLRNLADGLEKDLQGGKS